jgi:hypothetical protein
MTVLGKVPWLNPYGAKQIAAVIQLAQSPFWQSAKGTRLYASQTTPAAAMNT